MTNQKEAINTNEDILMGRVTPYVSRMKHWLDPKIKKSLCLFCSLGCGVAFRCDGDHAKELDYDKENPVCNGALCPRGHYNIELLTHPGRLMEPMIGRRRVSWSEALAFLHQELKLFRPEEIGIVLSTNASCEDAYLAARLAKLIGTDKLAATGELADLEAFRGYQYDVPGAQLAQLEEIDNAEALLIVGDLLVRSPVLSQRINKVKYGKRGNKIIVIDPNKTHTAWFATAQLRNQPGTEALVLAALAGAGLDPALVAERTGLSQALLVAAAYDFNAATSGTIIVVPGANKQRNDLLVYFAKLLAARSPNKKFISFYSGGNTLGVNTVLDREAEGHTSYTELLSKIDSGEIKAMIMLGGDLAPTHPELGNKIKHLKFVARSAHFPQADAYETTVQLPLASQLDGGGSYQLADGRKEEPVPVTPKAGAKTNAEIMALIMNTELDNEKLRTETAASLARGIKTVSADQGEILDGCRAIAAGADRPDEQITHFGNNELVKRFFWFRLKTGELS